MWYSFFNTGVILYCATSFEKILFTRVWRLAGKGVWKKSVSNVLHFILFLHLNDTQKFYKPTQGRFFCLIECPVITFILIERGLFCPILGGRNFSWCLNKTPLSLFSALNRSEATNYFVCCLDNFNNFGYLYQKSIMTRLCEKFAHHMFVLKVSFKVSLSCVFQHFLYNCRKNEFVWG